VQADGVVGLGNLGAFAAWRETPSRLKQTEIPRKDAKPLR
jgi:hypothetical protein